MDIKNLLERGVEEAIEKEHLEKALKSGKKLRVKLGVDPTAPDLHLGHTVPLRKLRQFQDAGHKAVLIIGDFTAKIGDPSGRDKTRPQLSDKEIKQNLKTYLDQAKKVLDIKKTEIRYNSEWFEGKWKLLLELMGNVSMERVMEREDFQKRIKAGQEVTMIEALYPILQGYDSVAVKADIEVGGVDQKFNLLMGRRLQRKYDQAEQDVVMLPLLVGLDGVKKMSKSLGNYIGITEAPNAMFGKIMSVPDELIGQYYELCTDGKRTIGDPREAKLELGKIIVGMYHSAKAAEEAKEEFIRVFSKHEAPTDIPVKKLESRIWNLVDLIVKVGLASSKSEARRLIEQGGVKINGETQSDLNKNIKIEKETLLQVGKKRFLKLK